MSDPKTPDIEREDRPGPPDASPSLAETASAADRDSEPVVREVAFPEFAKETGAVGSSAIDRVLDVRLTLSVELGRREMLVQDVLKVGQGTIIDLQKNASDPVDVLINGKLLARGEVVVVDESFGVRITQLVDPIERVRRMA